MAGFHPSSDKESTARSPGTTGWFYEVEGEDHGPIDFRTLRSRALDRKLLPHHLVWKAGSEDRVKASSIVGLVPPSQTHTHLSPEMMGGDPYSPPTAGNISDGPPGGLYLPHLHPANFPLYLVSVLGTLGIPLGVFFLAPDLKWNASMALFLTLAVAGLMTWTMLTLIYLHRAWSMMRTLGASLPASRAVRFFVFPFFNALWSFVVLFGWAKLWNENVRNHPGLKYARRVWPWMFFLFPILFLITQGLLLMHVLVQEWPTDPGNSHHLISLGVWLATLVAGLFCWGQMIRSINFLARKKF